MLLLTSDQNIHFRNVCYSRTLTKTPCNYSYLPVLRGRCENKGIAVKVVDLRWGISSKQSEEGMTLTICLRGVRDSNLFLGFYGARCVVFSRLFF